MPDTILAKVEFRFQDAEGNLLNDGFHSYKYDAENRIISVDGAATTYTYDAEDRRNWCHSRVAK